MKRKRVSSKKLPVKYRKGNDGIRIRDNCMTKLTPSDHYWFPPKVKTNGAELKFFDIVPSNGTILTTAAVFTTSMHLLAQGTGDSDRIGRKIRILALQCNWVHMVSPSVTSDPSSCSRFWLILDKQANGANPAAGDVFETTSSTQIFPNPNNEKRFTFLKQHMSRINPKMFVGANVQQYCNEWTWFLCCNIVVEFTGVTGNLTNVKSNNLFTMTVNSRVATTEARMTGRVYYIDE